MEQEDLMYIGTRFEIERERGFSVLITRVEYDTREVGNRFGIGDRVASKC
jgi:hypothetical protein